MELNPLCVCGDDLQHHTTKYWQMRRTNLPYSGADCITEGCSCTNFRDAMSDPKVIAHLEALLVGRKEVIPA